MEKIRITPELLEQLKNIRTAEELLNAASEQGISITGEEATVLFNQYCVTRQISDEELDSVAGGSSDGPKCSCGGVLHYERTERTPEGWKVHVFVCDRCLCNFYQKSALSIFE